MHYSFDFDYTLADSSLGTIDCVQHALAKLDIPKVSEDEIRKTIGLSIEATFCAVSGGIKNPSLISEFRKHFLAHADLVVLKSIRFYDSTENVLTRLKSAGHVISIVSTKFHSRIQSALERDGLRHLVDFIVGGDDVRQPKPDPEGLLTAIECAGISMAETIYIGDSESDGECAYRANVLFVGVLTGTTSSESLSKWLPKSIVPSISELADIFIEAN